MAPALIATVVLLVVAWQVLRRWNRSLIAEANQELQLPIPAFQSQDRRQIIDQLLRDDRLQQLIASEAEKRACSADKLLGDCRRYAAEIVPAFKAVFYFRIGYWLARSLLLSLYRVNARLLDRDALDAIEADASVVLVMNHRSNMDVLLVNYLASRRSTLMHTAGEWARMWPLYLFVRMAGNSVTDRDAGDILYKAVFKTFIQMAVRGRTNIAIFPEGELSRDGGLREPRLGLFSHVVTAAPPQTGKLYLIPVGINYDCVPEEGRLVHDPDAIFRRQSAVKMFFSIVIATVALLGRVLSPRGAQLGNACASFGRPVLLGEWQAGHGIAPDDPENQRAWVSALGNEIFDGAARLIPALATQVLATLLLSDPEREWSMPVIQQEGLQLLDTLRAGGAVICFHADDPGSAFAGAVEDFRRRKIVSFDVSRQTLVAANLPLLRYMANSISHVTQQDKRG